MQIAEGSTPSDSKMSSCSLLERVGDVGDDRRVRGAMGPAGRAQHLLLGGRDAALAGGALDEPRADRSSSPCPR